MRNGWFHFLLHLLSISVQDMCKFTIKSMKPYVGFTDSMINLQKHVEKNDTIHFSFIIQPHLNIRKDYYS
jgi:hypothetical protein